MESRWWEYYLVRYFVGSVLGAIVILFLKTQTQNPLYCSLAALDTFKDSAFLGVSLVAALGFAFCYIASAPILTVHATRAHLRFSVLKKHWIKQSVALVIPIGVAMHLARIEFPGPVAFAIGLVVGAQIGMVLVTLIDRFSHVEAFYRELASTRSKSSEKKDGHASSGMEYITSYRHLREHGNAFGILLLELILAGALFELRDGSELVYWLLAWLAPAPIAWVIGTVLESRMVTSPLP